MNHTTGRPREQRPGMVYGGRARRIRQPAPTMGERMRAELEYLARCLRDNRPAVTRLPDGPAILGTVRLTARSTQGHASLPDDGGGWESLFTPEFE